MSSPELETMHVALMYPMRDPNLCPVENDARVLCPNRATRLMRGRIMGSDTVLDVMVCDAHALIALDQIAHNTAAKG